MGGLADDEIPLLFVLFYLSREVEPGRPRGRSVVAQACFGARSSRETKSGGEFGWGGTSVKR